MPVATGVWLGGRVLVSDGMTVEVEVELATVVLVGGTGVPVVQSSRVKVSFSPEIRTGLSHEYWV